MVGFHPEVAVLGLLKEIESFGCSQMDHVWIITIKSLAAKHGPLKTGELQDEGKKCLVIDPSKSEVPFNLHWVQFQAQSRTNRAALVGYGEVQKVTRETWRAPGFEGLGTATRIVRVQLKEGFTMDKLPYQLKLYGSTALVLCQVGLPYVSAAKQQGTSENTVGSLAATDAGGSALSLLNASGLTPMSSTCPKWRM